MYGLNVKKSYIEFMQTREKPIIEFYGFNRNIMMQDIRYDRKDKLGQLFSEVHYDLDELYEVKELLKNTQMTKQENRIFLKKDLTTKRLSSFLAQDLPENSFGMQLDKNAYTYLSLVQDKDKFVTVIHHVGDFESLYEYANYKKEKLIAPESRNEQRKVSDICRQYLYLRPKPNDGPESRLISPDSTYRIDDVKFIKDYQFLMEFCFNWIGKSLPIDEKIDNDLFKIVDNNPIKIQFNGSNINYTIDKVIIKYFEYIFSAIIAFTGEKNKSAVVAYPKNYTTEQIIVLKRCIEQAKIKIIKEIDSLTQLFNKIQQLVNNSSSSGCDKLIPRFRRILDTEINDDKTCGVEVDTNGNLIFIFNENNELKRLRNHIGDIKHIHSKSYKELVNEFKALIGVTFKYLTLSCDSIEENNYIEIVKNNHQIMIKIKHTLDEYTLDYVIIRYLQFIANILFSNTSGKINKLILAYPMEYIPDQKSELIKCFEKVGFQFIKDVDVLEQYFNKIQNLLKPVYISEEPSTNRNRVILDESYSLDTFSIQQNAKGRCRITVFQDNCYKIVANHLGDVESAKVKINGSSELIKSFREFIEICCKLSGGLELEQKDNFGYFEITSFEPVKVKLKNTSIEYKIIDILNIYFLYLTNSTLQLEPKLKNIIFAFPYEFKNSFNEDIRKSIERTGLVLVKELHGLEQIFNRYENLVKNIAPEFISQEICSILHKDFEKENNIWGMEMDLKGSSNIGYKNNDSKFNTLKIHIGNLNQLIRQTKLYAECEFLKELRSVINYSLVFISKTNPSEAIKAFKGFEVSPSQENNIKLKNLDVEYCVFDILNFYFKIIHKALVKTLNQTDKTLLKIIVSLPLQYSSNETNELKKIIENSGFIVLNFINQLDQQFNRVINLLIPPYKIETKKIPDEHKYPTLRSILDEDLKSKTVFSIEFYPNLRLAVGFIAGEKHHTLLNHIGDLHVYRLNIKETEHEIAINRFENLIDFCFKIYSSPLKTVKNNKNYLFGRSTENKSNICFKDSTNEFSVISILSKYLKLIVESLNSCLNNKFKKVIIAGRNTYNQMGFKSLKLLLESSNLVLNKYETTLDQHFYRVLNELTPPYICETNKLSDTDKYPSMRSVPDESLLENNDSFSIEYYDKARLALSFVDNNKHYTILNHLGDLSIYKHDNNNDNYFQDALSKLQIIIELCILELINPNLVDHEKDYQFFKIVSTNPIKISFPYSKDQFTIEDIFMRLIKHVYIALKKCINNQANRLFSAVPIGNGKLNMKIFEESMKKHKIELKMNYNELERLFNRTQNQLNELLLANQDIVQPTNKSILSYDLKSEGMFGLCVDSNCDFEICAYKNEKYQLIEYHMGNIKKLLETNKLSDRKSVELLDMLLKYAYKNYFEFNFEDIIKENELFEISIDDPNIVKFKYSSEVFQIDDCVKQYIIFIKDSIKKTLGADPKELISVVTNEYDEARKIKLKELFDSTGMNLIKFETELEQIFNRIMNLNNKDGETEKEILEKNFITPSKYFNDCRYDDTNLFVVEMKENGDVSLGVLKKDNDFISLVYNVGLSKLTLIHKYCTNEDEVELASGFKSLLEFCFGTLGNNEIEIENINSDFFKISSTEPEIKFTLKDSTEEYTIEQFIAFYFEWISKWIFIKTGVKTKSMVLICPPQFGVFHRTDLKECLKNTSILVKRILTIPVAEALAISLIDGKNSLQNKQSLLEHQEQQSEIQNSNDKNKLILIDWNSGTINVTLSEQNSNDPLRILMSFQGSELKELQPYIDKILTDKNIDSSIFNSPEYKNIIEIFVKESIDLLNAILDDHNITQENVRRIDFCLKSEIATNIEIIFKRYFNNLNFDINKFSCQKDLNFLEQITHFVNFISNDNDKETIVKTSLCFNFGIKTFLGKFDILLKRGTLLPFKMVKDYCTVRDYQTRTLLNVYRGERPFTRFCEKLGVLAIEDLPKRKAGEVNINVGFEVDENETLKIEAKFVSKDDNNTITESELYEMHIDRATSTKLNGNEGAMIIEAQKHKDEDNKMIEKSIEINNLIDSIRVTCKDMQNQTEILSSINEIIDDINKNEHKLDLLSFQEIIDRLKQINTQMLAKTEVTSESGAAELHNNNI